LRLEAAVVGQKVDVTGDRLKRKARRVPGSNYEGLRRWGTSTVDQVVDQNWVTFNRDPVTVWDCASADVRARVDSKEVRTWIKSQIDLRFPF
jgi:hypothetical protein